MRDDLPSGTVTFLFTDIEGSTRLLDQLGEEDFERALGEHRSKLRESFQRHGGIEVDTQGDAFFYAFTDASEAVAAAAEAQQALTEGPIKVRIGLHTGVPRLSSEGYVGREVHRAARIAAAGHGGQVVFSKATRGLVSAEVGDLGEHRLKDFDEPIWLYQLGDERFPPLKTISNTNLPRPASSFVGRERELAEVVSLLRNGTRLVTLSGPGGSGKTRLSIEAAAELVPDFKNGVFWVGLATVHEPDLVLEAVAQTIGAQDGLPEHIGERELLLLLDNFEQVVEAARGLSSLLAACPHLRLLVTSRELLRIRGEVEYAVPPLAEPEAVVLFTQRARIEADETVGELCRRLDNLPLGVELAAARTSVLSPAQILARLSRRLDLFKAGRDSEGRQETLRATIAWSYDLLSSQERTLFARLSVFVGGCTLDSAEQVAEADLDTLQSLVDKSLVRFTDERFWMLETIREYATERLEESGETEGLRRRHAEHYLKVAEAGHLTFESVRHVPQVVAPDVDNMRAAIGWARAHGDTRLAVEIAVRLEMFWVYTNPLEGVRLYQGLLEDPAELPLDLRAAARRALGSVANPAGDDSLAERMYERSLRDYEALGNGWGIAELSMRLGSSAMYRGDYERARDLGTRSLEMSRRGGWASTETLALWVVGEAECHLGNVDHGMELIAKSAEVAGEIGFDWQRTRMLRRLADAALERGNLAEAQRAVQESLELSHGIGDRISIVFALARLAGIAAESGHTEHAGRLWGAVEAEEQNGALGAWYVQREKFAVPLRAHEGPEFQRGLEEGRRLTLDEAVEFALSLD